MAEDLVAANEKQRYGFGQRRVRSLKRPSALTHERCPAIASTTVVDAFGVG